MAAMLAVALACGGDAPAPLPTATPTPASAPSPGAPPPSTPAPTPASTPTPTATPTPTPEPTPTPFPTPAGPAVTVTGPLVVFSDRIGEVTWEGDDRRWGETRRVYVHDIGADTYWAAFDYEDAVIELAGARLIVWADGQLRRVGLNGYTEAVLFEREGIEAMELKASPDGTKVALLYDGTLLVLDVATGAELLRAPLSSLPEDWYTPHLGNWHADGNSLAVTGGRLGRTVLVSLDGAWRELPEGWYLSPGLRYAVRFTGSRPNSWGFTSERFEVIDVQSEAVLATVVPENHPSLISYETGTAGRGGTGWYGNGWRSSPDRYLYFEVTSGSGKYSNQYQLMLPDWEYGTSVWWHEEYYGLLEPRILDVATGDHRPISRAEWHSIQNDRLRYECDWGWRLDSRPDLPPYLPACILLSGEEFSWHGVDIRAIGVVKTEAFILRGVTPVERWRQPDAPALPDRENLVGPILVWSAQGDTGYALDDHGSLRMYDQGNLMLYDEGTKQTWQYSLPGKFYHPFDQNLMIEVVKNGFIMWAWNGSLDYVSLSSGIPQTIIENTDASMYVTISPNGNMVAVEWFGLRAPDRPIIVYGIPSGKEVASFDKNEIPISPDSECDAGPNFMTVDRWGLQGDSLVLSTGGEACSQLSGIISLDGTYVDRSSLACEPCLSPDLEYFFTGQEIIDVATGNVLSSLGDDIHPLLEWYEWAWISRDYFAWSSGGWRNRFNFQLRHPDPGIESAEVSVLHVPTGAVEVMDSAEYLARFHPDPRARAECPDDRTQPCRILLDGEVVGEGLWASIIGFIELDEDSGPGQ